MRTARHTPLYRRRVNGSPHREVRTQLPRMRGSMHLSSHAVQACDKRHRNTDALRADHPPRCAIYPIEQMESKIASEERLKFADRLVTALQGAGVDATPAVVVREFNPRADGAAITIHAARKWLTGAAFPTHERLHVLSRWLNVAPQWLRFGEGDQFNADIVDPCASLPLDEALLLTKYRRLDARSRQLAQELFDCLSQPSKK